MVESKYFSVPRRHGGCHRNFGTGMKNYHNYRFLMSKFLYFTYIMLIQIIFWLAVARENERNAKLQSTCLFEIAKLRMQF